MENKAEEIFLRKKIRENYSVPENFYLQHFDYLNAEKVLSWLKEYASQQKPEPSDLQKEVERLRERVKMAINSIESRESISVPVAVKLVNNILFE